MGADLSFDNKVKSYKIDNIYKGDTWKHPQSPLIAPGLNVNEGDYITSINGTKFNKAWTWGINNPFNLNSDAYRAFKAPESGISIATSGEYRNPDHIWGEGPEDAASVTVIANNTAEADAWATAIYALGIEEGLKVAERNGLAVFLIKEDGKTIESTMWGLKTFHPEQILEEIKEQIE